MRILLTGATGFLGSNLAHAFVLAGHEVAAALRPSSDTRRISGILPSLRLIDVSSIDEFFAQFRPQAVVHAATCYGRHGESRSQLMDANVLFPLKLLEHAIGAGTAIFINADTTLPPNLNGYALSKSQFVQWSRLSAGVAIRFANVQLEYVYGPGDDDTKFAAQVVRACVRGDPELKLSPGEHMRDFIYIDDAVEAFLVLLRMAPHSAQPWQDYGLGTGMLTSIREFAEIAKRESNSPTALVFGALPYRPGEPMRSCADARLLGNLGWRHKTALTEGIRRVIVTERASSGC